MALLPSLLTRSSQFCEPYATGHIKIVPRYFVTGQTLRALFTNQGAQEARAFGQSVKHILMDLEDLI